MHVLTTGEQCGLDRIDLCLNAAIAIRLYLTEEIQPNDPKFSEVVYSIHEIIRTGIIKNTKRKWFRVTPEPFLFIKKLFSWVAYKCPRV